MVVLAGEILKEVKDHVENGLSSHIIIKGLRRACDMAVIKIKEIAVNTDEGNKRESLRRFASKAMSSKLIHRNADFFTTSAFSDYPTSWLLLISFSGGRRRSFLGSR